MLRKKSFKFDISQLLHLAALFRPWTSMRLGWSDHIQKLAPFIYNKQCKLTGCIINFFYVSVCSDSEQSSCEHSAKGSRSVLSVPWNRLWKALPRLCRDEPSIFLLPKTDVLKEDNKNLNMRLWIEEWNVSTDYSEPMFFLASSFKDWFQAVF